MKYLLALCYFLSLPASAAPELKPLIFPGARVEQAGEHALVASARGSLFNRALQLTARERLKQRNLEDRRILGVFYARGVPFVVTEADDRKGPRLEWAVVTTFREGLSPRQTGGLVTTALAAETVGLFTTHTLGQWAAVTVATVVGALIVRPVLARQRGLRDLNLEVRPAMLDGKPAYVQDIVRDEAGRIRDVQFGTDRARLSDLLFSPNQADRLTRRPLPSDELVRNAKLRLEGPDKLIATPRFWEAGGPAEIVAEGRAFVDLFKLRDEWYVVRENGELERVRVMRSAAERTLRLVLEPLTVNAVPVTAAEVVRDRGGRVTDVKMVAEVPREDLVDPTTERQEYNLRGFPVATCGGRLNPEDYQP